MNTPEYRIDRSVLTVGTFNDDDMRRYWRSRTPAERLAALEFMRQVMYGYDPVNDRVQRVLEVAELERR